MLTFSWSIQLRPLSSTKRSTATPWRQWTDHDGNSSSSHAKRKDTYSESSKKFLCSSVRHSLTFLALMVFESLHGLTRVNCLIGKTWGTGYLEWSSSSNGFMGQGSMMSLFDLVISVFWFTESEHFVFTWKIIELKEGREWKLRSKDEKGEGVFIERVQ